MSRDFRSWWPVLLALAWAGTALALMRPDAIKAKTSVPHDLKWLISDETDLTAYALRGINFQGGRRPGRVDEPPFQTAEQLAALLDEEPLDAPARYYLEYPIPAQWLFAVPFLGTATNLPDAIADCHQYAVAQFEPRTDQERAAWTSLRSGVRFGVVVGLAGWLVLFVLLKRQSAPVWLLGLPAAIYFSLFRYDVVPSLFTAIGIATLSRGRFGWSGVAFAIAVLLKLYPVLFVPVILRWLGVRSGVRWLAGFLLTGIAGIGLTLLTTDWRGALEPVRIQLSRALELGWTFYGKLLPVPLGQSNLARLLILAFAVGLCCLRRPRSLDGVLGCCAIILLVFGSLAVFWSPQWLIWFLPLLLPLVRTNRQLIAPVVIFDLITYLSFPVAWWLLDGQTAEIACWVLVVARAVVWLWLGLELARIVRRDQRDPVQDFQSSRVEIASLVLDAGRRRGTPRGLNWVECRWTDQILVAQDPHTGRELLLAQAIIRFEPIPGSDMELIPAAREPRPVTVILARSSQGWEMWRPPVFNLSLGDVAKQFLDVK